MATMISEVYQAFLKGGAPEPAAREAAEALSEENLSTKRDVDQAENRLSRKIDGVEKKLTTKIEGVEKELTAKIEGVREELTTKIDGVEKELTVKIEEVEKRLTGEINDIKRGMAVMRWMVGTCMAGIISLMAGMVVLLVRSFLLV